MVIGQNILGSLVHAFSSFIHYIGACKSWTWMKGWATVSFSRKKICCMDIAEQYLYEYVRKIYVRCTLD